MTQYSRGACDYHVTRGQSSCDSNVIFRWPFPLTWLQTTLFPSFHCLQQDCSLFFFLVSYQFLFTIMSNAPAKKFVHKGQIVDSVPLHIRIKRWFQQLYSMMLLYLWTLFSIDARQAALSYSSKASVRGGSSMPDHKRLGRINNPNK